MNYLKTIESLKNIILENSNLSNHIYLVGGCVRDLVLGLNPKDIDLCIDYPDGVNVFLDWLKEAHSDICRGFTVYPRFNTGKFSLIVGNDSVDIECVVPRKETYNAGPRKPDTVIQTGIDEDAYRRDFCCNALYKNIVSGEILDPTGYGLSDCSSRILRTPLRPRETFIDDPLRMLRAIRFSCCKNFTITEEVLSEITDYPEYYELSMERVRDEFTKILMSDNPISGIRLLLNTGLLKYIIPTLANDFNYDQKSKYHHLTLGEHSLSVLDIVSKRISYGTDLALRLAALLHDISKSTCYSVKEDGTRSYHGHEISSGELAKTILETLRFPNSIIQDTVFIIKNHMCIKQFYDYSTDKYTGSDKYTRKIYRHLGDNIYRVLALIDADNVSHHPDYSMPGQVSSFKEALRRVKDSSISIKHSEYTSPVSGNDIKELLGIGQGRLIKTVKDIIQDYFDEDPGLSKEDLLDKYRKEFNKKLTITNKDSKLILTDEDGNNRGELILNTVNLRDVDDPDLPKINGETKILEAMNNPILYRRLQRDIITTQHLDDIYSKIKTISSMSGFKELFISLKNNDLVMRVDWSDNTSTGII